MSTNRVDDPWGTHIRGASRRDNEFAVGEIPPFGPIVIPQIFGLGRTDHSTSKTQDLGSEGTKESRTYGLTTGFFIPHQGNLQMPHKRLSRDFAF
jgi:hypothetical protein